MCGGRNQKKMLLRDDSNYRLLDRRVIFDANRNQLAKTTQTAVLKAQVTWHGKIENRVCFEPSCFHCGLKKKGNLKRQGNQRAIYSRGLWDLNSLAFFACHWKFSSSPLELDSLDFRNASSHWNLAQLLSTSRSRGRQNNCTFPLNRFMFSIDSS